MPRIDLVTGFLGSGKTTFLKWYAKALMEQKQNIGILENDFGAVNVDTMLLQDLEGDNCELEMVAGGCDYDCHRRRFKTKLIAMGMVGYDSVLVEPSGIYDTDEFFDVLWEEPLDRWYSIGSVIAVVDAKLEEVLSEEAEYLLVSQCARAGVIVLSRTQEASEEEMQRTIAHLNRALDKFGCERRFALKGASDVDQAADRQTSIGSADPVIAKDWSEFTLEDFHQIRQAGYRNADYRKKMVDRENGFESLYYIHTDVTPDTIEAVVQHIFDDPTSGQVFRIKGFLKNGEGWLQVNAAKDQLHVAPVSTGQEVLIVIGEGLQETVINRYVGKAAGTY